MNDAPLNRRALGRALTRVANASVAEALAVLTAPPPPSQRVAHRIGVTGPPGAGKSTLIARLARHRLNRGATVGIVAIDPSSPFTNGAVLGDRVRMDAIADDPRLFIRSLASRAAHDGLADNIADILATLDAYPFDEIILETVGVGQAEYAVRALVDTLVLVLIPESGDQIQAMKAGMLETASIYVVNKADLAGADKFASELRAIAGTRRNGAASWIPPVILCRSGEAAGLSELDDAVTRSLALSKDVMEIHRVQRASYHVSSLIQRSVQEILGEHPEMLDGRRTLGALFAALVERLPAHAARSVGTQRETL